MYSQRWTRCAHFSVAASFPVHGYRWRARRAPKTCARVGISVRLLHECGFCSLEEHTKFEHLFHRVAFVGKLNIELIWCTMNVSLTWWLDKPRRQGITALYTPLRYTVFAALAFKGFRQQIALLVEGMVCVSYAERASTTQIRMHFTS